MAASRQVGVTGLADRPVDVQDGTLCLAPAPLMGVVGAINSVAAWPVERKLMEAARRAGPRLPKGMRDEFAALFSGENLKIMGMVFGAWAASHAVGIGEIADVLLLTVGIVMLGRQAIEVARLFAEYARRSSTARDDSDLDAAAACLAQAISILGVAAFMALLVKGAKRLKRGGGSGEKLRPPKRTRSGARQPAPSRSKSGAKPKPKPSAKQARAKSSPRTRHPVEEMAAREGAGPLAIAARREVAAKYLADQGFSKAKADAHLRGIDFSKPVQIVDIPPGGAGPKGNQLYQHKHPNGLGEYYTTDPKLTPSELGVSRKALDYTTGKVVTRQPVTVEVPPGTTVQGLQSTAAPIQDTWSVRGSNIPTKGGGTQILVPKSQPAPAIVKTGS